MGLAKTNLAILGLQWGDEGKGKVVDLLSPKFKQVVRFQGGNNAGHTVVVDGVSIALHQVPSGALHPGCFLVVGSGVVLNLEVSLERLELGVMLRLQNAAHDNVTFEGLATV